MERRLPRGERGFTLIELLIVILIIGILSGIAIPMFLGKRERADDAGAKSNARNLVTYVDACYAEHEDFTRCSTQAATESKDVSWGASPGQVRVTLTTKTTYEVEAMSDSATAGVNHTFTIRRDIGGAMTRRCVPANAGGCKNGRW